MAPHPSPLPRVQGRGEQDRVRSQCVAVGPKVHVSRWTEWTFGPTATRAKSKGVCKNPKRAFSPGYLVAPRALMMTVRKEQIAPRETDVPPRLQMHGVRKCFGATLALDGVDIHVRAGEV